MERKLCPALTAGLGQLPPQRFTVKPMDVEEAILQMEMLGHTFFLYQDPTSEEIQVIYRRADGGYGLLVPEK